MTRLVLAIDQGTTRTKAVVFDEAGRVVAESSSEIPLSYPEPGWVEQDPRQLLRSIVDNGRAVLGAVASRAEVAALGLANQGETVVAWDRRTGEPVYNAIVWQDRRTDALCARLAADGADRLVRERTGLPLAPYFSAPQLAG
ncbi:MAG: glycerol kinase, partial [Thermomicrobiaceae bacterium]|nr:glycerol kinase [Thermomicrobiaceae bacterium]